MLASLSWALLQGCAGSEVDDDFSGGSPPSNGGHGGEGGTPGTLGGGGAGGGGGGAGGKGGAGAGGAATGGSPNGGEAQGGAPPSTCGNGVRDDTEQCEGTDFGGKQCADFGLGSGTLICNQFCTIVVSECLPKESCGDGLDNDEDGFVDCLDDECATAVACTDSCGGAQIATIPAFPFANLLGRPNVLTSSCAPSGGSEMVYQVQVPTDGDVSVQFSPFSFDGAFSVRTDCNDAASEILCVNNGGNGQTENGSFPGVAGSTYYVIFESTTPTGGDFFSATIDQPQPEDFCEDFWDDDFDGYLDCDDPTSCKGISFSCTPGTRGYAENCFSNTDCVATGGDPICLGFSQGFPDGYCSEFCSGPGDCPAGGSCVDLGLSVHGVCFKSCSTPADCPRIRAAARPSAACPARVRSGTRARFTASADRAATTRSASISRTKTGRAGIARSSVIWRTTTALLAASAAIGSSSRAAMVYA